MDQNNVANLKMTNIAVKYSILSLLTVGGIVKCRHKNKNTKNTPLYFWIRNK